MRFVKFRLVIAIFLFIPLATLFLLGCETVGYYGQATKGHLSLIASRQSIDKVLTGEQIDDQTRNKLILVQRARRFATEELLLPDNDSYLSYVELNREHVVWNVYAADKYSLAPVKSCFPIVGCLSYRGYFAQEAAKKKAAEYEEQGLETYVGGITAYSTLGWFDDPMLSTMLTRSDLSIVGLIFHELAHQQLYIQDDTAFNESFATTIELEGIRRWLEQSGINQQQYANYELRKTRHREFIQLLLNTRKTLAELYAQTPLPNNIDELKSSAFSQLNTNYLQLKSSSWENYTGYDGWFEKPINNARLIPVSLYHDWVPSFQKLLELNDYRYDRFYTEVKAISRLSPKEREQKLIALKE